MKKIDEKIYKYIVNLANNAGDSSFHRCISLRKVITKDKNYINKNVYQQLMKNNDLTIKQKKILKEAVVENSKINKKIIEYDKKTKYERLNKVRKKNE